MYQDIEMSMDDGNTDTDRIKKTHIIHQTLTYITDRLKLH